MKKLLFAGILGTSLMAVSCSTVQNAKTAQTQKAEFLKLKGDWEITSVTYDSHYKIKPFDEGADAQCFVGSVWKLIPNNYTGSYTLNGGGTCPSVSQPIKFEVLNGTQFQFKKIADGTKAKANISGYVLNLEGQSEDNFTLVQNVPFNGEIVKVNYNFRRLATK